MDFRKIRRFGRPKKSTAFGAATRKAVNGLLVYTSDNGRWTITVDHFIAVGSRKRPGTGRIFKDGLVSHWMRLSSDEIRYGKPENIPAYVKHAIERCTDIGTEEFGHKSQRKIKTLTLAMV